MNVTPLGDRVIITPIERKGTAIIVPETTEPKIGTPTEGTVIAAGPGHSDSGHWVEMTVKIGDVVLFGARSGVEFEIDNQKCRIMREFEIMAIVNSDKVDYSVDVPIVARCVDEPCEIPSNTKCPNDGHPDGQPHKVLEVMAHFLADDTLPNCGFCVTCQTLCVGGAKPEEPGFYCLVHGIATPIVVGQTELCPKCHVASDDLKGAAKDETPPEETPTVDPCALGHDPDEDGVCMRCGEPAITVILAGDGAVGQNQRSDNPPIDGCCYKTLDAGECPVCRGTDWHDQRTNQTVKGDVERCVKCGLWCYITKEEASGKQSYCAHGVNSDSPCAECPEKFPEEEDTDVENPE